MSDEKTEYLGCVPNGSHLYRKPDCAGGYVYSSDEVGGGVQVWRTSLVSEGTLLAAIACEHHRKYLEYHKKNGWKPHVNSDLEMDNMAVTGEPFLSPDILEDLRKRREEIDG